MSTRAIASNRGKPFILRKGISTLSDLRDGASAWGYPGDYPARTYFVNNIHGASTNEGLSWDQPFAQVSEAITASEAYRALYTGTTNDYQRNIIYVQGTGTAYTKLTALPSYCDIIGIGQDPRCYGSGVARIGSDSVAESGVAVTAAVVGLGLYNLQFQAGINKYPFSVAGMTGTTIDNCAFMTNAFATGNPTAAFHTSGACASIRMTNCMVGGSNASVDTEPDIGFKIAGSHWMNSKVSDCHITGLTGISVSSSTLYMFGSIFKDNYIGQGTQEMVTGVLDASDTGSNTRGYIVYAGNYIDATTPFNNTKDAIVRCIGNYASNGFVIGA